LVMLLVGLGFIQPANAQYWSRYPSRRAEAYYGGRYDPYGYGGYYPTQRFRPYYYSRRGYLLGRGIGVVGDLAERVIDGHYESEIVHDAMDTERQGMNTGVAQQALGQGYSGFEMNAGPGHVGYQAGSGGVPGGQQSLPPIVNFDEETQRRYVSVPPFNEEPAEVQRAPREGSVVAKLKKFRSEGLVGLVGVSSDEEGALNDAIIEMADPRRHFLHRGDLTDEAPLLRSLAKKAKDPGAVAALHEAADYFEAHGRG